MSLRSFEASCARSPGGAAKSTNHARQRRHLRPRVRAGQASSRNVPVLALFAVLGLLQPALALTPDLREVFNSHRCYENGRRPVFPFKDERLWLLEANAWSSSQLTTAVAAIILREGAGYGVDINVVPSPIHVYERMSQDRIEGPALEEHFNSNRDFGYANLEVWPGGHKEKYTQYVSTQGDLEDMGLLGYEGRSGWFVAKSFVEDPEFLISPEFYRAYDRTVARSKPIVDALLASSSVTCGAPDVCNLTASTTNCLPSAAGGQASFSWCSPELTGPAPTVLAAAPFLDQGFNEELSTSNSFGLAIKYVGLHDFASKSVETLQNGTPQIVHIWRPSLTLTRLHRRNVGFYRITMPSEDCGMHLSSGGGDWACDFPLQSLHKLAAMSSREDPVVTAFLHKFTIRQGHESSLITELEGGGIREMLAALDARNPNSSGEASAEEIFAVACEWVKANEISGAVWSSWVPKRNVPFFADSLHWLYPWPVATALIASAILYIVFIEWPWLHTTLTPSSAKRILRRKDTCRTDLELRLREATKATGPSPSPHAQQQNKPAAAPGGSTNSLQIPTKFTIFSKLRSGTSKHLGPEHPEKIGNSSGCGGGGAVSPQARFAQTHAHTGSSIAIHHQHHNHTSLAGILSPRFTRRKSAIFPRLECASGLIDNYWKGLSQRAAELEYIKDFWKEVEQWNRVDSRKTKLDPLPAPPMDNYVFLAHHTFSCVQRCGSVSIPILRRGVMQKVAIKVKVIIEECAGGAQSPRDFQAGEHLVTFGPGEVCKDISVPIVYHKDIWQNSYWFRVRLAHVIGDCHCRLATPFQASVLVLDEDSWPAGLGDSKRGGEGVSLMRYFIYAERTRRGEKWRKTMLAMCFLPVHSVAVSTLVQKILVDHVVKGIQATSDYSKIVWFYAESVFLVLIQLISLGLHRWADVVQTRNRGRTGGIRQHHRGELLRKYMHMEHSEHWLASDASWLYAGIYDADVITGDAYFQVFVLFQSLTALSLSVLLVVGLVFWGYAESRASGGSTATTPGSLASWYVFGVVFIIPLGLMGVWWRRELTWVAVIVRKDFECAWFKSCTWIMTNWRHLFALSGPERASLEKRILKQNSEFVPAHWDARDTMNDTAWLTHWIQGVAYCCMLLFGLFALCEYNRFGIGAMEVGTYYALCKIYLNVGKYVGRLSGVFVNIQRAIVSLREIAALSNQVDQRSQRREARLWADPERRQELLTRVATHVDHGRVGAHIVFPHGLCFVRPLGSKVGSTFSEIRVKKLEIPLGRIVHVFATNERVLRSFLGLTAKVIQPTDDFGHFLPDDSDGVWVPYGLTVRMLPTGPVGMGATAPSIIEQLEFTGAPKALCQALVEAVGLEPERETASLGTGSMQVFSIVRAILLDPDVLCAFRPLAVVPIDMRDWLHQLMRLWQGGGGLPSIAKMLGVELDPLPEDQRVYRSPMRTLILGNPEADLWAGFGLDVKMQLDQFLWRDADFPVNNESASPTARRRFPRGWSNKSLSSESLVTPTCGTWANPCRREERSRSSNTLRPATSRMDPGNEDQGLQVATGATGATSPIVSQLFAHRRARASPHAQDRQEEHDEPSPNEREAEARAHERQLQTACFGFPLWACGAPHHSGRRPRSRSKASSASRVLWEAEVE